MRSVARPSPKRPNPPSLSNRSPVSRTGLAAALLALALLLAAGTVRAQPIAFGKNKVQYTNFEWRVLKSAHFHLYFYEGEEELARLALDFGEESYRVLRGRFVHEVPEPIPLIIYSSHQDFEQTNVTPYFLPEGVAGLTEFARGRVLIPYGGSMPEFKTTLQHELVHVFQRSMLGETYRQHFRTSGLEPPLWFTEGLAVHWSEGRDREADMILRDLVHSGGLPRLSDFWRYDGTFTVYKLGQSMLDYIGEEFGEERIHLFYSRLWEWNNFDEGIRDVLGVTADELSDRWSFALKERYFPDVERARPAAFASQPLTAPGGADFKPLPLPDSTGAFPNHFAFLSPRNGFTNLYVGSREGEEREVESVVDGDRSPGFESFHAYRSRMDVSSAGDLIFVAQRQDRDEVVTYSLRERKVIARYRFPNLVGITSPSFAPDGRRFVMSGLSADGYSDLYLFDPASSELRRLTHDRYQDLDPAFCPWRDQVVWSSDRCAGGDRGARNLFLLDLVGGPVRHLTRGRWIDAAPAWDPAGGGLYFSSDRDGVMNVWRCDEEGNGHRLTRSLDGIFDPRPIRNERRFLATVFHGGSFQVRSFARPDSAEDLFTLAPPDTALPWSHEHAEGPSATLAEEGYRPRFSLDVAQGGVLVDPAFRSGEGVQAALSDLMGNHLIFVQVANSAAVSSELLKSFSAGVTYVNLKRRLNYGVSAFHWSGDLYDGLGIPYYEKRAGAGALLSYPLSKFERIDTRFDLAYAETDRPAADFVRHGLIAQHSISFIHDTSLWLPTGPIDGRRFNVTAALTMNLASGSPENTLLLADWRRYFRLGLRSAYAVRLQGRWSEGENPEFFRLGGSQSLRIYPRRALIGQRALLANQEVRLPIVRGALLGLPMGNLELPAVEGAAFFDVGSAFDPGIDPEWKGSYGVGFRMGFGGLLVLRWDIGKRTDFTNWGERTHTDFFLGWDY